MFIGHLYHSFMANACVEYGQATWVHITENYKYFVTFHRQT